MKKHNVNLYVILTSILLFVTACSKDKKEHFNPGEPSAAAMIVKNLPADPVPDDDEERPGAGTNLYTLFRFSDSTVVANSDSATTGWDIGFRGTSIILNNSLHGPGKVTGRVIENKLFKDLKEIPKKHYRADSVNGDTFAGWYHYNSSSHVISPKPGHLFVIHTPDRYYIKMQILSYYKGAPGQAASEDVSRYYTFKYVVAKSDQSNF